MPLDVPPIVTSALVALAAFVLMEPATYAAHRWLMHGPARRLHRSHHRHVAAGIVPRLEANDAFPLAFAALVVALLAVGYRVSALGALVPACLGVTAYGAAYLFVHDVAIHRRWMPVARVTVAPRVFARLAEAHLRHHRDDGEPYGMLWWRLGAGAQASGSRPSQVPREP